MDDGIRRRVAVSLAFAAALTALLLVPLPYKGRASSALGDLAHAPVFAVLAYLVFRVLDRKGTGGRVVAVILTLVLMTGFGCATEIGQHYVGRTPSMRDLAADTLGAIAGTAWAASRTLASRRASVGLSLLAGAVLLAAEAPPALVLSDAIIQRFEMPRIASFEQPLELSRWIAWDCQIRRVRGHATDGDWSLAIDLEPDRHPGVGSPCPPPDWSSYKELIFDAELDAGPPIGVAVGVDDQNGASAAENRLFSRVFQLVPGTQQIRIPVSSLVTGQGRHLDPRQIRFVELRTTKPDRARTLFLDNIRLQ